MVPSTDPYLKRFLSSRDVLYESPHHAVFRVRLAKEEAPRLLVRLPTQGSAASTLKRFENELVGLQTVSSQILLLPVEMEASEPFIYLLHEPWSGKALNESVVEQYTLE